MSTAASPRDQLDKRFKIFSHYAYSKSHALGTGSVNSIRSNIDLKNGLFNSCIDKISNVNPEQAYKTSCHLYHSWQFLQSYPQTKDYWKNVLTSFGLNKEQNNENGESQNE